jgi:1-acyl-sn-glycerol-3-phosphate acyltransferase
MKRSKVFYFFLKNYVRLGLFFYFRERRVLGMENIPKDKPVLLLSNHQNALLDVLLLASRYPGQMHYLARSDVFKRKPIAAFLRFLNMHPAFRMRDGYKKLTGNYGTFKAVTQELLKGEHVLLFPEASHCLDRRIRPLNKGFTRLVAAVLDEAANIPLQIVPIGQNYTAPLQAGESSRLIIGKPMDLQSWLMQQGFDSQPFAENRTFARQLTLAVEEQLKDLTTHLGPFEKYPDHLKALQVQDYDFRFPLRWEKEEPPQVEAKGQAVSGLARLFFRILHYPFILLWITLLKPRVPEIEFTSTFRFAFVVLGYPLVLGLVVLFSWLLGGNVQWTLAGIGTYALLTLALVRAGITTKPPTGDKATAPVSPPH